MKYFSDNIKQIIAYTVILTGIIYIFCITFIPTKTEDKQGLIAFVSFINLSLGYYLGSTTGMGKKDDIINKLTTKQNERESSTNQ